ncbi:MAG: hypothetical protein DRO99_04235 [Candidatus Aenigmatarchaeota archaeon]|nr:MAG: hypothetical protein DRO99_04235 [Candidatus Aenigmarchaeota archaeon]
MEVNFDQHMIVDPGIIRQIVEIADIDPGDTVLEIGPGTGNLTRPLSKRAGKVIAVEIDKRFTPMLKAIRNVEVVEGNALDEIEGLDFERVVSNIPYAICEPLVRKLFRKRFILAILTVPKGFAHILTARRDDARFSKLTAAAHAFFDIESIFEVPREAFEPPPDTDSVVIRMRRKGDSLQKEVLLRDGLKAKNAIARALFISRKMTKNEAKKAIKSLEINNNILDRRLKDLDSVELDTVLGSLKRL